MPFFSDAHVISFWQDYRIIYVGAGRAPQGGNVNNGRTDATKLSTHAQCRPEELNRVHNPNEPDLKPTAKAVVMAEDGNADPISENAIRCALGDFTAGSYNISVYMGNRQRTLGGSQNSGTFIPGLAIVYDDGGYFEAGLLSKDSAGVAHMVNSPLQLLP